MGNHWWQDTASSHQALGHQRSNHHRGRNHWLQDRRNGTCRHFRPSGSTLDGFSIHDWILAHERKEPFQGISREIDHNDRDWQIEDPD